jgi:hypothetical protein
VWEDLLFVFWPIILPAEGGPATDWLTENRWLSHQLPIKRRATDAAKTSRLRVKVRGWRVEDGGFPAVVSGEW